MVRLRMEWPHEVPARLLAMGERAEVLQPAELRSQVGELARRVAERYSVPPTAPVHPTTTHSRG